MTEEADERLRVYESMRRQEPKTLPDLFLITEFRAKGMSEHGMAMSSGQKIELGRTVVAGTLPNGPRVPLAGEIENDSPHPIAGAVADWAAV